MTDIGKILADLDRRLKDVERTSRLGSASVDDTSLEVRDADGGLRGLLGQQADGTTAVNIVNGPTPPAPSTPAVASDLGGVKVTWDGTFADAAVVPLDFSRVEIHAAAATPFIPDLTTLRTTIESPQGGQVRIPADDAVYVLLLARSTSGTASPASDTVGPYSPAPVVASDILDGIVTTLKLADDAVTAAKVATGAIDSDAIAAAAVTGTAIAANAVTAGKILAGEIGAVHLAAGSVQTDKLDAEAVNASKIAAGAVTTAKLDALSVTADKIAVNAITASKISAGAVDATAIAADAITGKAISGGTITGAVLRTATTGERVAINESAGNDIKLYDSTGTLVATLDGSGLRLVGDNGSVMTLNPDAVYPYLEFSSADGLSTATIRVAESTPGAANIETRCGAFTSGAITDMRWRTFLGADYWVAERYTSTPAYKVVGGRIDLRETHGTFGYLDNTGTTPVVGRVVVSAGMAQVDGRVRIEAPASDSSALYAQSTTGHTGYLMRLYNADAAAYRFAVDLSGNTEVAGVLTAGNITSGRVTITPSAANTPTSLNVTGLNLKGTSFRVTATAVTSLPGTQVTGVGVNNQSATGFTVWLTRTNTTSTGIDWIVVAT